jgi:hypothetical protein
MYYTATAPILLNLEHLWRYRFCDRPEPLYAESHAVIDVGLIVDRTIVLVAIHVASFQEPNPEASLSEPHKLPQ